jgi:hypothetical protein
MPRLAFMHIIRLNANHNQISTHLTVSLFLNQMRMSIRAITYRTITYAH